MLTTLVLALAAGSFPPEWSVKSFDFVLTRVEKAPLRPAELVALEQQVRAQPAGKQTPEKARLKARVGPRLTLTSKGLELWSIDASDLPWQSALIAADGNAVVVYDTVPDKKPSGQPLLAVLGPKGARVKVFDLEGLVGKDALANVPETAGAWAWTSGISLSSGVASVQVNQSPQPPRQGEPMKTITRTIELATGAVLTR